MISKKCASVIVHLILASTFFGAVVFELGLVFNPLCECLNFKSLRWKAPFKQLGETQDGIKILLRTGSSWGHGHGQGQSGSHIPGCQEAQAGRERQREAERERDWWASTFVGVRALSKQGSHREFWSVCSEQASVAAAAVTEVVAVACLHHLCVQCVGISRLCTTVAKGSSPQEAVVQGQYLDGPH